jgi:hypothetical protein
MAYLCPSEYTGERQMNIARALAKAAPPPTQATDMEPTAIPMDTDEGGDDHPPLPSTTPAVINDTPEDVARERRTLTGDPDKDTRTLLDRIRDHALWGLAGTDKEAAETAIPAMWPAPLPLEDGDAA